MERISKILWNMVVFVFGITALLTICGIGYLWFVNPTVELPYLETLFVILIVEIIGVCLIVLKSSISFMPKTKIYKEPKDVNEFLLNFAMRGSSVEFVSNRASWISSDEELKSQLISKVQGGSKVTILSPIKPMGSDELEKQGIDFINSFSNNYTPNARFTLINSSRQGAEELAIAVGSFPEHKVYVFNGQNSPYIIAMAKDIVKLMEIAECIKNEEK